MTQQPFSRPGAIDLSALKRPAPAPGGAGNPTGPAGGANAGASTGGTAYSLSVDEPNFQSTVEASMAAPVLFVFFSPTQHPASAQLADDMATLADEFEGRFLVGKVDIDAVPAIAQAMQVPSVPMVIAVIDGRPMPLFQDVLPLEELRAAMTQVIAQLTSQGITSRHQPRGVAAEAPLDEDGEPKVDPRYAPAQDALAAGDIDAAVAEYQKLVDANPADFEAAAGLAMAKVLARTQGVDGTAARSAAAEAPDDVEAQTMVADLDLLGGHVDDAFDRLVGLVQRCAGSERDAARQHLIGLFAAVGNEDVRVLKGRQKLANALF